MNKKMLQKSPRMAKQSMREPVPGPPAAEQPPAPLQTMMSHAQIKETQSLQAEMLRAQTENKAILHKEGPEH